MKESLGNAVMDVDRIDGADGIVSVKWKTISRSAVSGKDYGGKRGTLTFGNRQVCAVKCLGLCMYRCIYMLFNVCIPFICQSVN